MIGRYNFANKGTGGPGQTRIGNGDNCAAVSTIALAIDKFWACPILLPAGRLSKIGYEVSGAGGAGCKSRLALCGPITKTGIVYPGQLLLETAEADATATGLKEDSITLDVDEGMYWMVLWSGGGTLATFRGTPLAGLPSLVGYTSTPAPISMISAAKTYSSSGFAANGFLTTSNAFPSASPTQEVGIPPLVWVAYSK
jgi:hypothetical protein